MAAALAIKRAGIIVHSILRDLVVLVIGDLHRPLHLHLRRDQRHADFAEDRNPQELEEERHRLAVGDAVDQHQPVDIARRGVHLLHRDGKRDAAAVGMADQRRIADLVAPQIVLDQPRLVED